MKKEAVLIEQLLIGIRRRPTLPGRVQPSTIGAERLNFCVRYGNRWDPFAIATGNCIVVWGAEVGDHSLIHTCPRYLFFLSESSSPLGSLSVCPLPPSCSLSFGHIPVSSLMRATLLHAYRIFRARCHTLTTAQVKDDCSFLCFLISQTFVSVSLKSSPRPISIIKLHPLPNFHR